MAVPRRRVDRPLFGQIIEDATPASIQLMLAGDRTLAGDRDLLFRALGTDSRAIRHELLEIEEELVERVGRMHLAPTGLPRARDGFTRDLTRLTVGGRRNLEAAIRREARRGFERMEEIVQERTMRTARRSLGIHARRMEAMGFPAMTREQRQAILQGAQGLLDAEFPRGSGLSYRDRLRRIQAAREQQMLEIARRTYPEGTGPDAIRRDLERSLSYARPGTPIRGGSSYKQSRRLLVAEETRIANAVELATVRSYGIQFAYWRLSPNHPWYGGKEVCEVHASRVSPDTVQALERVGIDTAGVALEGLYLVRNYPQYPHPFCKCYPEPFVLPEQQAGLDRRQRELDQAAREIREARAEAERAEAERRQQILLEARGTLGRFRPAGPGLIGKTMYRLFGLDVDDE